MLYSYRENSQEFCQVKWDTKNFSEAYWTFNESGYCTNETQVQILRDYMIPNIGGDRPQIIMSDGFQAHELVNSP